MRVPPLKSWTPLLNESSDRSRSRWRRRRVTRVNRVEKTNASRSSRRAIAWAKIISRREYFSIEPLTSQMRTSGRRRMRARRAAQVDAPRLGWTQPPRFPLRHAPRSLLEQAPHLLCLLPGHLLEILVAQELLGAIAAGALGDDGHVLLAVHLRLVQAERVRPCLGAFRRQRQCAATPRHLPGGGARIGRRPEDVKGSLER